MTFVDEMLQTRVASEDRGEQRHARSELRDVQNDLRIAQLRIRSAFTKLEDLDRHDLVGNDDMAYATRASSTLDYLQLAVRTALAGLDIEAPLPSIKASV